MWSQGEDVISNLSEMCAQSRKMDQGLTLVLSFFSIWFYKIVIGTGVAGIFLDCFRVRAFLSLSHLFSYLMHSEWLEAKRCLSSEATFGFFFFNYVDLSWHLSFICLQILKILFVSDELFFKKRYCFSCGLFFFPPSLYWICYNIASALCFFFFGLEACGILALWPGIKPTFHILEGDLLNTRLPGKSPDELFYAVFLCLSFLIIYK